MTLPRKALHAALLSAFPSRAKLAQMVQHGLGENLNEIAAESLDLQATVFALLDWAEAEGRVQELLEAAFNESPGNPDLTALLSKSTPPDLRAGPDARRRSDSIRQNITESQQSAAIRFPWVLGATNVYGYLLATWCPAYLDPRLTTHKVYGARHYPNAWLIVPTSVLVFVGTWLIHRRRESYEIWWRSTLPLFLGAAATVPILAPEVPHPWLTAVTLEWLMITIVWLWVRYSLLRQHDTKTGKISLSRKEFISRLFLVAFCIPLALLLPAVSYMKNAARETVTDPGELDILNRAAVILVGSQVIFWCCGPVLELFRAWKDADR